jgi:hypothetical protein
MTGEALMPRCDRIRETGLAASAPPSHEVARALRGSACKRSNGDPRVVPDEVFGGWHSPAPSRMNASALDMLYERDRRVTASTFIDEPEPMCFDAWTLVRRGMVTEVTPSVTQSLFTVTQRAGARKLLAVASR